MSSAGQTTWAPEGTYTAIVTPFNENESIDWTALTDLVDAQIAGGVNGVVPCGTTGESPALSHEELHAVIKSVALRAKGKTQVIAGVGTSSTHGTIENARAAMRAGADAIMVVVPYYNKPTQEGLYRHFTAVAAAVPLPLVVYNIPGRTGIDMSVDTLARICETAPNVVAIKEATGNVMRCQQILARLGARITVLSGDDSLTLPMIAVGAKGVISVTSNVLPKEVSRVTRLALDGKMAEARALHLALFPVHEVMFIEANPGPAKAALAEMKVMKEVLRGPMAPVSEGARKQIVKVLADFRARGAV